MFLLSLFITGCSTDAEQHRYDRPIYIVGTEYLDSHGYAVYRNNAGLELIFDYEASVYYTSDQGPRLNAAVALGDLVRPMAICSNAQYYCVNMNDSAGFNLPINGCPSHWATRGAEFTLLEGGCDQIPWIVQIEPAGKGALFHYEPDRGITKIVFASPSFATAEQQRFYEYDLASRMGLLSTTNVGPSE